MISFSLLLVCFLLLYPNDSYATFFLTLDFLFAPCRASSVLELVPVGTLTNPNPRAVLISSDSDVDFFLFRSVSSERNVYFSSFSRNSSFFRRKEGFTNRLLSRN